MDALLLTVAAVLGLVIVANATGVVPVGFVVTTTLLGLGLAPFVGDSLERHIPSSQWDRISLARDASRRWGVEPSNAFFPWIGCNRLIFPLRRGQASGAMKGWESRSVRPAAAGHAWAFLLHVATVVWAGVAGGWVSLVSLLTVGVICHLYPVLLQIHVLTRLRER